MNIPSTKDHKQVVSLEELVPQHDCLKLLILHTPYVLLIDTLPLCVNLVKLDLSKNNLHSFPHLGALTALRFMFLHENRLDLAQLKNIFEQNGQHSILSSNIVWVTFWGNRHQFLARHYLANQTSAIAVDKHMIAPEERQSYFPYYGCAEAFSAQTDISAIVKKKSTISRHASEEQYMNQLWGELKQLRRKHERLFPAIKIQKIFRGWRVRQNYKRTTKQLKEKFQTKKLFFLGWKQQTQRRIKLQRVMASAGKQYLLAEGKEARRQQIAHKMVEWAQRAKKRTANRSRVLINELRFIKALRSNYDQLNNLYSLLGLQNSKALYIAKNSWNLFEQLIIPFVARCNSEKIRPLTNNLFSLHSLYDYFNEYTQQTIKMYQTNIKSVAFEVKLAKSTDLKQLRRGKRNLTFDIQLKSTYQTPHHSTAKLFDIKEKLRLLDSKTKYSLQELVRVEGSLRLLKDIVRAIYYFNTKRLPQLNQSDLRIQCLSQYSLKRISSAIKIQKVWRGYRFRSKNQQYLRIILRLQRAATIIQRWYRCLPTLRRKEFTFLTSKKLATIYDNYFYIETKSYLELFSNNIKISRVKQNHFAFQEQQIKVYIDRQARLLSFGWNPQSYNSHIIHYLKAKKIPFSSNFFLKQVGFNHDQLASRVNFADNSREQADISHLLHFETQTAIIRKQHQSYLEIQCATKAEAKFRCLLLKLLTYSTRNKEGVPIFTSQELSNPEISFKIDPKTNSSSFICNQNIQMLQMCQRNKVGILNTLHVITNKFYFPRNDRKPIKAQEKFFIYSFALPLEAQQPQPKQQQQTVPEKRYKTQVSCLQEANSHFLTDFKQEDLQIDQPSLPQERLKKIVAKRSMKQFKIDKRLKQRKPQQPSFILDSISINDRLTTQPQVLPTQPSVRESQADRFISKSSYKAESADIQRAASHERNKFKSNYAQQKAHSLKRQEDDSFIRRFVNQGNFIQNQFASDYRRRQKIKSDHSVVEAAENIRRSMERSHSQRVAKIQQRLKDVREKHSQHRQLMTKNQQSIKDQAQKIKTQMSEQREKRLKQKSKVRRLKVSFAEECYPLGKNRNSQYFS